MKPLIIIPARYASTRFPGKPLANINGKSMIMHVFDRAKSFCNNVFVATDDERIFDHVLASGGMAIMTSEKHQSGTDRINEAFGKIENNQNFDIVINLQGDEPFIEPAQISELTNLFSEPEVMIGTLAREINEMKDITDPNKVKVVFDKNGKALYFSRSVIPFIRETEKTRYYKHVGIYAFRAEILKKITAIQPCELENTEKLEQLRWLYNGYNIHLAVTHFDNISVDTPEDLKKL